MLQTGPQSVHMNEIKKVAFFFIKEEKNRNFFPRKNDTNVKKLKNSKFSINNIFHYYKNNQLDKKKKTKYKYIINVHFNTM